MPATLFSKIHIDIMLMPRRKGYRYIVAARDDLSRATEGKALRGTLLVFLLSGTPLGSCCELAS